MRSIRGVLFDLGRVLVEIDFQRGLLGRLTRMRGHEQTDELVRRLVSDGLFIEFNSGRLTPAQFHERLNERLDLAQSFDEFAADWCGVFSMDPRMDALLREVADAVTVGILSDTDPLHWAHIRRTWPVVDRVKAATLSYQTGVMKPAPLAYARAAENLGLPPEAIFYVDDLAANVEGARQAGMDAVLFAGPESLRAELIRRGVLGEACA